MDVGIRELRDGLSRHLAAVRAGETITVTDHGKPALEVRPYRSIERDPLDVLRGSVVRYEDPTEPVADDDWAAAQ